MTLSPRPVGRGRWGLFTPAGERVLGIYGSPDQAKTAAEKAMRKGSRIERPCMCCTAIFPSEGPHNRLCARCR